VAAGNSDIFKEYSGPKEAPIAGCRAGTLHQCDGFVRWLYSRCFRACLSTHRLNVSSITINASGAALLATDGLSPGTATGYARLTGDGRTPLPAGQAILGFSKSGVLISETAVPSTNSVQAGRVYAEVVGSVNTGLAIANPNDQPAVISYLFTDSNGMDFGQGSITLAPNSQTARFLSEPPFSAVAGLRGTFTFRSTMPVAALCRLVRFFHDFLHWYEVFQARTRSLSSVF
jgi:hypothetical protein